LTLNTIAQTVGAAGAGAQAAVVFGSAYLGLASAVLTLLILIFSEIIPKTLGALHWKVLAPAVGKSLKVLVWLLMPFVKLTEIMTRGMKEGPMLSGFSRREFAAMAELSAEEGQLAQQESNILQNLLKLRKTRVKDVMTPRTVVFSLPETTTVEAYYLKNKDSGFSRIPIYRDDPDQVVGFVLRQELLREQASGHGTKLLKDLMRKLPVLSELMVLTRAFDELVRSRTHVSLVVDEYGSPEGILTLEDILETLLGFEIIDEGDEATDMQAYARQLWQRRARKLGIELSQLEEQADLTDKK
jgi:CBS domain containing-hemolysin-like protein